MGWGEPEAGSSWKKGLTVDWVLQGAGAAGLTHPSPAPHKQVEHILAHLVMVLVQELVHLERGGEGQFSVDPTLPHQPGRQGRRLTHPRVCALPTPLLFCPPYSGSGAHGTR